MLTAIAALRFGLGRALALAALLALSTPAYGQARLDAYGGTGTLSTRDSTDAFLAARVAIAVPLGEKARGFLRGDLDRTQDGGELATSTIGELKDSFRSIEIGAGARFYVAPGFSVGGVGGLTYAVPWGRVTARDPRLWTGEVLGCFDLPEEGYGCLGGGWRGPVGGYALSASVSRLVKGVTVAIDFDMPVAEPGAFYTVKVRAIVRLKRFEF